MRTKNSRQLDEDAESLSGLGRNPTSSLTRVTVQLRQRRHRPGPPLAKISSSASNNSRTYQSIYERKAAKRLDAGAATSSKTEADEPGRTCKAQPNYLSQTRASQNRSRRYMNAKLTAQAKSQASLLRDVHFEGLNSDLHGDDELQRLEDLQRESAFDECISVTIPPDQIVQARSFDQQVRGDEPPSSTGEPLLLCGSRLDTQGTELRVALEPQRSSGLADFLNVHEKNSVAADEEVATRDPCGQQLVDLARLVDLPLPPQIHQAESAQRRQRRRSGAEIEREKTKTVIAVRPECRAMEQDQLAAGQEKGAEKHMQEDKLSQALGKSGKASTGPSRGGTPNSLRQGLPPKEPRSQTRAQQ